MMKNAMLSVPFETKLGAAKNTLGDEGPLVLALNVALPSKTNSTPLVRSAAAGRSETPPNGPYFGWPSEVLETVPPVMVKLESCR